MLELHDIQSLLIHGRVHGYARYLFVTIENAVAGRRWLASIVDNVSTAVRGDPAAATTNVAVTHDGLRALGLASRSLDSFPEEFRAGMPARREQLGDTGVSAPEHWSDGFATPELHAMVLLFAQNAPELDALTARHRDVVQRAGSMRVLSSQDATRLPGRKEHFGYQEGISEVMVEGSGREPLPGQGPPVKAGEFFLGQVDESGVRPPSPAPEALGRNGSYVVYRRLAQDVAGFRAFLRGEAGDDAGQIELLAAKLMGRWRSGAPLVLAPDRDDPALAADPERNSAFGYADDPKGISCPIGAHTRRVNPRDMLSASEQNRHRLIRRGLPYGPALPDGAPDDGVERGSAVLFGVASIARQFEFVQRVWINNRKFEGLENEKDPIAGDHDGTTGMTIPRKPFRKRIHAIPRFVTVRGGGYFFLPGITGLRYLITHS